MNEESGKETFWKLLGWALLLLGFGGCCLLANYSTKDHPLIEIHMSK